MKQPIVLRCQK